VKVVTGKMSAEGRRVAIVVSRWNELVTKALLEGAIDELARYGGAPSQVIHVPGTWEIPVVVSALLASKEPPDAIVALGCILQGQTTHAQLLSADVSGALMTLQTESKKPISWGILTPDTLEQALDRSGAKHGNKGREAMGAVVEMMSVLDQLD
jgi:6,7-dimethyl-8-ribityllumazine synthase